MKTTTHTTPAGDESLEAVSIIGEHERTYHLAGGRTYTIEAPVALAVKPSGSHRVLSREIENGQPTGRYVSHYIDADGKRPVEWVVKPGEPFFKAWTEESAEGIEAPATQPQLTSEPTIDVGSGPSLYLDENEEVTWASGELTLDDGKVLVLQNETDEKDTVTLSRTFGPSKNMQVAGGEAIGISFSIHNE